MTAGIVVHGLRKQYGHVTALHGLSFEVPDGTVTGFLGPNGAGKTTTLRILLGLVRPTAGAALVAGVPYAALRQPARHVGAVLEATGFHPGRTAVAHLQIVARAAGITPARAEAVLDEVQLTDAGGRRVGGYSLGMRQRLGIAVALLGEPEVLILDEPANGLDPEGIHWLRALLRRHAEAGGTVLVSSHQIAELARSADHVVVVRAGRLAAVGPVGDVVDGHADLESAFLDLTTAAGGADGHAGSLS